MRREYSRGRPIQWAAFSSTTTNKAAAQRFVKKDQGVIFKLSVLTGCDIGRYSYFPDESEILLSPNTRFTVVSTMYTDERGYACIDLAETHGNLLAS